MKYAAVGFLLIGMSGLAFAAGARSFSGTWRLDAQRSTNIGHMGAIALTSTVSATARIMKVHETSVSSAQGQVRDIRYDTSGRPVTNESPMGERATTVSVWSDTRIITTWSIPPSVNSSARVVTEIRSVGADGNTMKVEWRRGSNSLMTMIFVRD